MYLRRMSPELCDFLECCMRMDPRERPRARELLDHPFIQRSIQLGFIDPPTPPRLTLNQAQKRVQDFSNMEVDEMIHKLLAW